MYLMFPGGNILGSCRAHDTRASFSLRRQKPRIHLDIHFDESASHPFVKASLLRIQATAIRNQLVHYEKLTAHGYDDSWLRLLRTCSTAILYDLQHDTGGVSCQQPKGLARFPASSKKNGTASASSCLCM